MSVSREWKKEREERRERERKAGKGRGEKEKESEREREKNAGKGVPHFISFTTIKRKRDENEIQENDFKSEL